MWPGDGDGADENNVNLKKPESRPKTAKILADRPTLLHC
jgi:hypothetical protein